MEIVRLQAAQEVAAIQRQLELWDFRLADLGGDPSREDWALFRPLRLVREEDWSDWLAYLLADPHGAPIAERLFPAARKGGAVEEVMREVPVAFGRRADLVLLWGGERASHVEAKIGDTNFEKTVETGRGCRQTFPSRRDWADYILLPEESLEAWSETEASREVPHVTWTDVAREIRTQLARSPRATTWSVLGRMFVGAVEQKVLGIPHFPASGVAGGATSAVFRFGRLLKEANEDGQGE